MTGPTPSTIKRLFAVSGNRCAFPECNTPLLEESGTLTGEICHIRAAKKLGPRWDSTQSEQERHSYANLILMCPRHHTIIDAEHAKYTVATLESFKQRHTLRGPVEISPQTAQVAAQLLQNYSNIHVAGNSGLVAINSPGAVQVSVVNVKSKGGKVVVGPTEGSVAHNLAMRSYIEYLISRYQDCQKADRDKTGDRKYMLIHNAVRREFGCKWDFVPVERFAELATYLQGRINNTRLGRNRNAAGHKLFHSFEEHGTKGKNA